MTPLSPSKARLGFTQASMPTLSDKPGAAGAEPKYPSVAPSNCMDNVLLSDSIDVSARLVGVPRRPRSRLFTELSCVGFWPTALADAPGSSSPSLYHAAVVTLA